MTVNEFNPVQTTPFNKRIKIKIHLWKFVNSTIFRWIPNQFKKPRIFLLRLFGAELADTVNISRTTIIDLPWNLKMGHLSSLGDNSWVYCLDKIDIGEKCCIGKDVYLLTGSHTVHSPQFDLTTKPIKINDCCWLATGSYILPGIVLGKFSVIGAMSVVTKNTEDNDIVAGNPAKFIKKRKINF
jgi:putative colanic acid biosynthesis acetyltransferase WcaF